MKNTYIAVFGLAAVVIGGLYYSFISQSVSGRVAGTATSTPIGIGAVMILSGEGATWGEASRNGMALAIEDINKSGGVLGRPFKGIYEDDQSDPKAAVSAFNKLVDSDGAKFIIGPNWSNTGLAVRDLAAQAKVVMVSPSLGVADFNEGIDYVFNTWPHDKILSPQLAYYVYGKGHRHVALFGANDLLHLGAASMFSLSR